MAVRTDINTDRHIAIVDEINKKILAMLFRDGRVSQRSMAKRLGLSVTSLNYRFVKLVTEGVIRRFSVYVNPNLYGKYYGFVSFENKQRLDKDYVDVSVLFLEKSNVYMIEGESPSHLEDEIGEMSEELGVEPRMVYIPENQRPASLSGFDALLLKALMDDPRAEPNEVSKATGLPSKAVGKRIKSLTERELIKVLPIVDLSKADILTFGVFSERIKELSQLERYSFLKFVEGDRGLYVCVAENVNEAREVLKSVREVDKDAEVMVGVEYDVKHDNAMKEVNRVIERYEKLSRSELF